jgi:GNAT superfamily N-acetyltransferase
MPKMDSTDERLQPRMFDEGNRIRFIRPVDEKGRDWWIERFYDPFDLTPEGMGDALTKSAVGDKLIKYEFIDGVGQTFRLRVEGSLSGQGEAWFVERTFELSGNFFNADEMFVTENSRGSGTGRRLMGDLIDVSRQLHVDRIKIQTQNIGRYAWLRVGFRPDVGSWRDMQKNLIAAVIGFQNIIGLEDATNIAGIIAKGGPETANIIAAMSNPVPSRQLFDSFMQPVMVSIGRALLIEYVNDWSGEFVLADPEMERLANAYIHGGESD